MKMLGLNPMEQEIIDVTNEIARNGLIYFPEFCRVVHTRYSTVQYTAVQYSTLQYTSYQVQYDPANIVTYVGKEQTVISFDFEAEVRLTRAN